MSQIATQLKPPQRSLDEQMPTLLERLLETVSINDAVQVTFREPAPVGGEKVFDVAPSNSLRMRVDKGLLFIAKSGALTEKSKELRDVRVTATTLANVREIKFKRYEVYVDSTGVGHRAAK